MAITVQRVQGPEVQEQGLPGYRNTTRLPADYNRGLIEGVQSIGTTVAGMFQKEQEKADLAQVMAAKRKLSDWERSWFDPANDKGVYAARGQAALGLDEVVAPDFDRHVSELATGMSDAARAQFEQIALSTRDSVLDRVQGYALREHDAYLGAEYEASVANSVQQAASAALDGRYDDQAREASFGLAAIRARAATTGEPAEATRIKEAEFLSTVHATAINGMLVNGDINAATDYLDANVEDLTPTAEVEIRQRMQPMMLESMVDEIEAGITTGRPLPTGAGPVAGAATTVKEAERIAEVAVGRTIALESEGVATAKNPRSTATGAAQFLKETWLQTMRRYEPGMVAGKSEPEILAMRNDPDLSRRMAVAYGQENARFLFESGLPVTEETVYLAHRFGPAGAAKLLRAPPGTPVSRLVTPEVLEANPDLRGKTVAALSASHEERLGADSDEAPVLVATGRTAAQAMRDRAAAVPNVLLRRKLEARADRMEAQAERAEREYSESMKESIWEAVGRGEKLTPEQASFARDNRMEGPIESERLRQLRGTLVQDDPRLVEAFHYEAMLSPDTFLERDLRKFAAEGRLSPATLERMLGWRAALKDPEKRQDWTTDAQRRTSGLALLGLQPERDNKTNKNERQKRRGEYFTFYDLAYREFVQMHGKKPSPAEADRLVSGVAQRLQADPDLGRKAEVAARFSAGLPAVGAGGQEVRLTAQDKATVRAWLQERKGIPNPTDAQVVSWAGRYYSTGE